MPLGVTPGLSRKAEQLGVEGVLPRLLPEAAGALLASEMPVAALAAVRTTSGGFVAEFVTLASGSCELLCPCWAANDCWRSGWCVVSSFSCLWLITL